ncbi:hypothetical protein [Bosea minatitlanensis]|uniref:Uncharacterized protein n=1 Tax=Bosea minatitlanensis TaxID=128782 RepID=A0ABW0F0S4_9HYPH|nr:hypothetical protein [Bosea minatitlanensis]MCT4494036.1 hypothetical protein [Bosea minatitlanensis]
MSLPFSYTATVLPSRRHRIPDRVNVRAYTDVLVPELSASEIHPAIVIERRQPRSTLFDWNGRLFRPARRRSNGEPLSVKDFQREVSERFTGAGKLVAHAAVDFDPCFFPTPNSRWNVASSLEGESSALSLHTFAAWVAERGWRGPVVQESSEDCERGRAQALYAETFIVVDGALHIACPEPVWAVRTWPRPPALCLWNRPTLSQAAHCFRLDEFEVARAWADQIGAAAANDERRIHILSDSSVKRHCLLHLARSAAVPMVRYAAWPPMEISEQLDEAAALCERLEGGAIAPDTCDVAMILDAMTTLHRALEADVRCGSQFGYWSQMEIIVQRWAFEIARGEDLSRYSQLSDEDLEALYGL